MLKQINGKSEEEVLEIILKVCKRSKNKYKIKGMDSDDIYQESFFICVDALDRYDGVRSLENFLAVALSNKLKNLYRDTNTKAIKFVSLDDVAPEVLWEEKKENLSEFIAILNEHLSVDMRHDYIKYTHGVQIPRVRRQKLIETIKRLADERWL